ncbi:DNA polymerase III subunit beta [Bacillus paranthracis]|uniref:DNA polymerase III subunit beta n=1 Tax=Bacillus cereus group TaxID=86661 RepID=UPI0014446008|nr:DNA polymerase III subunit beta [Bacillus paranthracis]NKX25578.1 DNA polymerase III subunit beta [Bacillus paranthracis]
MEFTINKQELLNNLVKVGKYSARSTTLPILCGIYLKATSNELLLVASNKEDTIVSTISETNNFNIIQEGEVVVPKTITDIVKKLPDDTVSFTLDNNNSLHISSGKTNYSLNTLSADDYPDFTTKTLKFLVTISLKKLQRSVEATHYCAAENHPKPQLKGIEISITNKEIAFAATDANTLSRSTIPITTDNNIEEKLLYSCIVPSKWLYDAIKMFEEEEIELGFEGNSAIIRSKDLHIKTQIIEGKYPDVVKFMEFEKKVKTTISTDRLQLINSLEQVNVICSMNNPKSAALLKLELNSKEFSLSNNNKSLGDVIVKNPIEIDGETIPISIGFSIDYMLRHLKSMQDDVVKIGFIAEQSPLIFRNMDTEDFKLMLPIRIG